MKMFLRGRPVTMHLPRDQVDAYSLEAKADLPTKRLKLEWVYPSVRPSGLRRVRGRFRLSASCLSIETHKT